MYLAGLKKASDLTMGCTLSAEEERSRRITRELRRDYSRDAEIKKLLLLGAGESGKSTIVKQMKLMHPVNNRTEVGFSEEERSEARQSIYENIFDSIITLIDAADELNITMSDNKTEDEKLRVKKFRYDHDPLICPPPKIVQSIDNLWHHQSIIECYRRRNEFQLNDSAEYFLSDVKKFCTPDFFPTDQDILRTRVKTTGIVKIEFQYKKTLFNLYDVGGQRSERKKWIHCFDNVTAVLFVMALSEYDQVLFEDRDTNRMQESLKLFGELVNSIHFRLMSFIVFFNKQDLFQEKIKSKSIRHAFPEYDGPDTYEDSLAYIVDRFLEQNKTSPKRRQIYQHITTATDTKLVKKVFNCVADIILGKLMGDIGLN